MRLICVHSLTAHGTVGLKPFLAAWGERCLPVPSVVLSGPGNMAGCQRMPTELGRLLDSTLAEVAARGEQVCVFIGYLANEAQVDEVCTCLDRHAAVVHTVIVDPVSGDDGKAYVAPALLAAWPRLLERATVVLPNLTEIELLTGRWGEDAIAAWRTLFPAATTLVTGVPAGEEIETWVISGDTTQRVRQVRRPGRFSGTGDLFAALWVRDVLVHGSEPLEAARTASAAVGQAIDVAVAVGGQELPLPGASDRCG